MNSLYPSLLGAIVMLGWFPIRLDTEGLTVLGRELTGIALGYLAFVVIYLVGGNKSLFWLFLMVANVWLVLRIVLQLNVKVWSSILSSYILTLLHVQVLSLYPFAFWCGVPVSYFLGVLWFLVALSAGPDPRQKLLTLSLAFLMVGRPHFLEEFGPPDGMVYNGYWIGLALLSVVFRIQFTFHSKFEPMKPGV